MKAQMRIATTRSGYSAELRLKLFVNTNSQHHAILGRQTESFIVGGVKAVTFRLVVTRALF